MTTDVHERLAADELILIDGATGTELQRRGVPMDLTAWSGAAVLSHPEVVREIHEDYIRAGAGVVITNTFGSTRQMLEPAGFGDRVAEVHRRAVELAIEARTNAGRPGVVIAGSISAMPPGFDRSAWLAPQAELESYREAAGVLTDAGVELIALEMLEETQHAPQAVRAAYETGLPVWTGISCKRGTDGSLVGFGPPNIPLEQLLDVLLDTLPAVVNIMHSPIDAIPAAIDLLRQRWSGPIGVYPESGYFTKPDWNFVDVIEPQDLVTEAVGWVAAGVRLIGGCCGTGPEHIRAIKQAESELLAAKSRE